MRLVINKMKGYKTMAQSTTTTKKLQVKDSLCGIFNLAVIVTESVASYVLYFSGKSVSLDVVAAFLIVDAGLRAAKQFVVVR